MCAEANDESQKGDRIAKVMARAGLCSRRKAEEWIAAGRVKVNGEVLKSPALNVTASDEVLVDGKPLPAAQKTDIIGLIPMTNTRLHHLHASV